jgi:hypothetical protein
MDTDWVGRVLVAETQVEAEAEAEDLRVVDYVLTAMAYGCEVLSLVLVSRP